MAAPITQSEIVSTWQPPLLELVHTSEHTGEGDSRQKFESYLELRNRTLEAQKLDGEALREVQTSVRAYLDETGSTNLPSIPEERFSYYTDFSQERARKSLLGLTDYLETHFGDRVSPLELETTRAFIDSTFAMYEARPEKGDVMPDADGSFAFVVPARVGRNHPDYGSEVEPAIPALRYVPNELRAAMLAGLPPFVIDTYKPNQEGKRGYLVFAPVFEDMEMDLGSRAEHLRAARQNTNAAVDFAHRRFGVEVVGLGATLPALTRFGKEIRNQKVAVTTGHAGTIDLIRKTVELHTEGKSLSRIGVLGLGSIGESIARITAHDYPDAIIAAYDPDPSKADRVSDVRNIITTTDEKTAIEFSKVVISAVTVREQLCLRNLGVTSLEGTIMIDDSQPASLSPKEVEELGGAVVWVIGRDVARNVARGGYDYGTMVDGNADLFGCEAEAASIAAYRAELRGRGMPDKVIDGLTDKIALTGPVAVRNVRLISALFTKMGIVPSEAQAFGHPVDLPVRS